MMVVQRRNMIKDLLMQERSVKVADLVKKFNVSEETIRRDLNQLERDGIIQKNYGGAILVDELYQASVVVPPVHQRAFEHHIEKDIIGRKAAEFVKDDQIIIMDAGSTTWLMAKYLREAEGLTVVTNGLNVADECSQNEDATVIVIGGKMIRSSASLVGPQAEMELQKYNAHITFLGTSGISLRKGFTSSDLYEAEVKRAMIAAGQKVIVLADHSKFQRQALISFSSFHDVDILITTDLADPTLLREVRSTGVEVIVCPYQPVKEE